MLSDEVITVKPVLGALADELSIDDPLGSETPKGLADTLRGPPGQDALQLAGSESSLGLGKPGQYKAPAGLRAERSGVRTSICATRETEAALRSR